MKPNIEWLKDWEVEIDIPNESEIFQGLVKLFIEFWDDGSIGSKSKTTMHRYGTALHALGGYIVENTISKSTAGICAKDLVLEHIESEGGPFVYRNDESWQDEFDMVCRKLFKYMQRKC